MAELRKGDRVFIRDSGFYGAVTGFAVRKEDYAPLVKVKRENKPTDGLYSYMKVIKLHPEDQPGDTSSDGDVELKDCTDRDETIAVLQKGFDELKGRYSGLENNVDCLKQRVKQDEKKMEENDGFLHNELCTLIHRVEALEKARQQDVENSRQMKEVLVNMVKQWEQEDEAHDG